MQIKTRLTPPWQRRNEQPSWNFDWLVFKKQTTIKCHNPHRSHHLFVDSFSDGHKRSALILSSQLSLASLRGSKWLMTRNSNELKIGIVNKDEFLTPGQSLAELAPVGIVTLSLVSLSRFVNKIATERRSPLRRNANILATVYIWRGDRTCISWSASSVLLHRRIFKISSKSHCFQVGLAPKIKKISPASNREKDFFRFVSGWLQSCLQINIPETRKCTG